MPNKIERPINYPYFPGSYGIPFGHVFGEIDLGLSRGDILGGSGRELEWNLDNSSGFVCFSIIDERNSHYQLSAVVSERPGQARFILFTKTKGSGRHPDMYAKKFIGVALNLFDDLGIEITHCLGDWYRGQTRIFDEFTDAFNSSQSKSLSAKETWAGRAFGEYGFTEIIEDDVVFFRSKKTGEIVQINAIFWK